MKKILLSIVFSFFALLLSAQFVYKIKADSVRITNDSCTAELIIENRTKDTLGFLYNKGKGRTEFRSGSGNFILNQNTSAQNAKFWVNGQSRIDNTLTFVLPDTSATPIPYFNTTAIQGIRLGTYDAPYPSINNNALISFGQHHGPGIMIFDNINTKLDCYGFGMSAYALQSYIAGPAYPAYFTWNIWGYQEQTGTNEIMRLKNNGNLMLGTSNDEGYRLSVNGNTKVSGSSEIGNYLKLGSLTADPTGSNGMMYYNSSTNKFRAFENSAWKDLTSGGGFFTPNQVSTSNTSHNANYKSFLLSNLLNTTWTAGTPSSNKYTNFSFDSTNLQSIVYTSATRYQSLLLEEANKRIFARSYNAGTEGNIDIKADSLILYQSSGDYRFKNIGYNSSSNLRMLVLDTTNGRIYKQKLSPTQSKNILIESPTTSENLTYFYTDKAITIAKVADVLRGSGSPSVTYNIRYATARDSGSPTNVFSSNRTLTSTSGSTTTSFSNSSIPAGSWVWIITSATGGTVNEISIAVTYSEN